jgi:large subunit ribosomal protein L7/L12
MAKLSKDDILKAVEEMSVLELADLVKALEEKFGVSAAPVAVASPQGGQAPAAADAANEQTTFNVVLTNAGSNKISVIKAVRELVPTLGLQEAKALVESAPKEVLTGVNKKTAEEAKTKLTAAGATVDLK